MTRYSKEEKAEHVERWKASGKSPWIYAKGNGVNPHTFVKWTQGQTKGPQGFIEVRPETGEGVWDRRELVVEKGDLKIHIPFSIQAAELRIVLEMLRNPV